MRKNDEHPQDYAQSRFTAFWMIVCALAVFVVVLSFVLKVNSGRMDTAANAVEDGRAEERFKTLAKVNAEQQSLVQGAAVVDAAKNTVRIPVADGMRLVLPLLKNKKAGKTEIVVPGSPTSMQPASSESKPEGSKDEPKADAKSEAKEEGVKADAKQESKADAKGDAKQEGAKADAETQAEVTGKK